MNSTGRGTAQDGDAAGFCWGAPGFRSGAGKGGPWAGPGAGKAFLDSSSICGLADELALRAGRLKSRLNPSAVANMLSAKYNKPMNYSEMARALGRKGGKARAARLVLAEKRRIAALGGRARALSLHATRRIAENFRYVEVMDALRPRPPVMRLHVFAGPLPGLHAFQAQEK